MANSQFTPPPAFALAAAYIRPRNEDGGSSFYGSASESSSRSLSTYSGCSSRSFMVVDVAEYTKLALDPSTVPDDMDLASLHRSDSWTSRITPEPSTAPPSRSSSQRTVKTRRSVRISSSVYSTHSSLDTPAQPQPISPGCGGSSSNSTTSSSPAKPKTAVEKTQELLQKVSNQWATLRDTDLPAQYRAQWAREAAEIKRRCIQHQVHSHERQFEIAHTDCRRLRRFWLRAIEHVTACRSPVEVKLARRAKKLQRAYVKQQVKWREETLESLLTMAPDEDEVKRYLGGVHGDFLKVNLELDLEPIAGKSTKSTKSTKASR